MSSENEGGMAGNRQINANTTVTIGLVVAVTIATVSAVWKASEVVSDLGYVKLYISELRSEVAEIKRAVGRLDRQPGAYLDKKSDGQNAADLGNSHIR